MSHYSYAHCQQKPVSPVHLIIGIAIKRPVQVPLVLCKNTTCRTTTLSSSVASSLATERYPLEIISRSNSYTPARQVGMQKVKEVLGQFGNFLLCEVLSLTIDEPVVLIIMTSSITAGSKIVKVQHTMIASLTSC